LRAPAPRQKLRSRRNSSVEPKYAPRRTQAERSEATRKQLLEAAAKLIRQKGFGGLRTIEVASMAGVSRGALMHHFPSKHALVVAVLTYTVLHFRARPDDDSDGPDDSASAGPRGPPTRPSRHAAVCAASAVCTRWRILPPRSRIT